MKLIVFVFANLVLFVLLYFVINSLLINSQIKSKLFRLWTNSKYYYNISNNMCEIKKRNLLKNEIISESKIIISSFIIFLLVFIVNILVFKSFGMSIILATCVSLIPNLLINYMLKREKNMILNSTITFLINLRNHISHGSNIILAIRKTKIEGPLQKYIKSFLERIDMGMDVYTSFVILKEEINIKQWNLIITSLQACYMNGGDYTVILTTQINTLSKVLAAKEKEKEDAYSSVITLFMMIVMSVFLVIKYACLDYDSANIITRTVTGKLILTYSAISYVISIFFISKIYNSEG